ncbi:hypothetical protein [Paenibacillus amylolyticus]|uniref:hypothetical protein n=2 Tax=Paenibacillus TaxID=44249 RepID=UPI0015C4FF02|nr:hypothetical protein [Paenibacillus amylolyticus]
MEASQKVVVTLMVVSEINGGVAKFKSDMGSRLEIENSNDAKYYLYSNTKIPQQIKIG